MEPKMNVTNLAGVMDVIGSVVQQHTKVLEVVNELSQMVDVDGTSIENELFVLQAMLLAGRDAMLSSVVDQAKCDDVCAELSQSENQHHDKYAFVVEIPNLGMLAVCVDESGNTAYSDGDIIAMDNTGELIKIRDVSRTLKVKKIAVDDLPARLKSVVLKAAGL